MTPRVASNTVRDALDLAGALCQRYRITALEGFLASCRGFAEERTLNIAVLGRFKAGKSSFLNHLLGRPVLPVGVIPVTTVVTEIQYGPEEQAEIRFQNGRTESVPVARIREFIAEAENPGNAKGVRQVHVALPTMEGYQGLRFVDTPGLDSVFAHNTDAAREWLPNVGLALVAVGVDPPLSQHDIELIQTLRRYTPHIALLLTKVDVLAEAERAQVLAFVRQQLERDGGGAVPVFPYSIRPGFGECRAALESRLLGRVRTEAGGQRQEILRHKLDGLLRECGDYLTVALKAAERTDAERETLRRQILGPEGALEDTRVALRLILRHTAGTLRATFEERLRTEELPVRDRLLAALEDEFPAWSRSLREATARFDAWLGAALTREMGALSRRHQEEFGEPVRRVAGQLTRSLQDFRNRLSERTLEALGVPLRTTELELAAEAPRAPDVRVGRIFDHHWELLSFLVPRACVRGLVRRHFARKVADAVFMNLSRLTSQWEGSVMAALTGLERGARQRLEGLLATIETLLAAAGREAPEIRKDLEQLEALWSRMSRGERGALGEGYLGGVGEALRDVRAHLPSPAPPGGGGKGEAG